jgi:FMN-dependent NADH-azoreductase
MHLLNIQSSPRRSQSASIAVADAFLEAYRQACPEAIVDTLNVWDGKLLKTPRALLIFTRGASYAEDLPTPPPRFDHQKSYLEFWLQFHRGSGSQDFGGRGRFVDRQRKTEV